MVLETMDQEERAVRLPRNLPLTGGDYFILALDHQMRRSGLPGNICRLMVDLDGSLNVDLLRSAIDATGLGHSLGGMRLSRRMPFSAPHWRLDGSRGIIPIMEHRTGGMENPEYPRSIGGITRLFGPRKTPLLGFDLFHGDNDQTTLVLTWHHGLMDAHGAELFLRLIDHHSARYDEPAKRGGGDIKVILPDHRPPWWTQPAKRWRFARRSLFLIDKVCRPPIASVGASSSGAANGNRYHRIIFTEEESRRIDWACDRAGAGFQRSLYFLAAAMRAFHRVRLVNGGGDGAYVVPMPLDCRKRCSRGPLLSNQVSFLFFRADPEQLESLPKLIRSLSQQMMEMIRCEASTSFATALDFFRHIPLPVYSRLIGGPTGGKMASFYFSDTGLNLHGMDTFLRRSITDLIHLAPVPMPPGLGIITGRFRERLYLILSWVSPCLNPDEQQLMAASLSHDLLTGGLE